MLAVVEFLLCKLDVLQGMQHVLVVDDILYVLYVAEGMRHVRKW